MLVSPRHKFIFLSNHKCASTSIIGALKPHCAFVAESDHRLRHTKYREFQQFILPFLEHRLGPEVSDYKIYCLFREPTDWLYSWYRFRSRPKLQGEKERYTGGMAWQDFLAEALEPRPAPFATVGRQAAFVTGLDGKTEGLTLFAFEALESFWCDVSGRVGRALDLPRLNMSPKRDETAPSDADRARCRQVLAEEYAIYDGLVNS